MYRALIADDEPMIREGLKVLVDWEHLGFRIVASVEDGDAALEYVDRDPPIDLLITDVKMPTMTGIELLQKLREQNSDLRVIVISGYNDFDYVRTLVTLGIENYLLKPVNEDELEQTLINVARKLEKEREQKARTALDQNLIRENIINRWVHGSISDSELQERARFLDINLEAPPYRPVLMKIPHHAASSSSVDVFHRCRQIFQQYETCYCSRNYNGDILAIFAGVDNEDVMMNLLAEATVSVNESFFISLRVAVGHPVDNYWQIADSFGNLSRQPVYVDLNDYIDSGTTLMQSTDKSPFSIRLAQYVLDHYMQELSLKQLSAHFRCNAAYIGQAFKKDIGVSFGDYLKQMRIEKAKELLRESSMSTGEIAVKVGYANVSYFFSIFKKTTGLSPSEYRRFNNESKL